MGSTSTETTIGEKEPVIASRGVRVARGDTTILRGVSVEAREGEVVGVLGPSGAGKSTLFRSLVGELAVEGGQILLAGEDVTTIPLWARARRGLAYVPQTPSVLWDLSVRENLRVYRRIVHGTGWLRRTSPDEDAAIDKLARKVDLDGHMDVRAGELSGGERRRLEIARALTRYPKALVCDEPFAGVDPRAASRIGDMLKDLALSGVAVLLADHHVAEALRICSRAVLLLDGQVAVDADPETFEEDPLVVGRYLGSWARSLPPPSM